MFTKAPNVARKTSEMKGATVKDAQSEASLVRIPMTPTVFIPLSLPEVNKIMLMEVAARSTAARLLVLRVRTPPGTWMSCLL